MALLLEDAVTIAHDRLKRGAPHLGPVAKQPEQLFLILGEPPGLAQEKAERRSHPARRLLISVLDDKAEGLCARNGEEIEGAGEQIQPTVTIGLELQGESQESIVWIDSIVPLV